MLEYIHAKSKMIRQGQSINPLDAESNPDEMYMFPAPAPALAQSFPFRKSRKEALVHQSPPQNQTPLPPLLPLPFPTIPQPPSSQRQSLQPQRGRANKAPEGHDTDDDAQDVGDVVAVALDEADSTEDFFAAVFFRGEGAGEGCFFEGGWWIRGCAVDEVFDFVQ
jgi:hypothetical protein